MTAYCGDAREQLLALAAMGKRYGVLLLDPPWHYDTHAARLRKHYDLMTQAAIRDLPVGEVAAKDCGLFLWATMPCLPEAFEAMQAWGFRYVTNAFTFVKVNRDGSPFYGMGGLTRSNAELCLYGVKGKPVVKHNYINSVFLSHRRAHSRKPDQQYERIAALHDGPMLEVFARQCWPGWDCIGLEVGKFLAQPPLITEALLATPAQSPRRRRA